MLRCWVHEVEELDCQQLSVASIGETARVHERHDEDMCELTESSDVIVANVICRISLQCCESRLENATCLPSNMKSSKASPARKHSAQ